MVKFNAKPGLYHKLVSGERDVIYFDGHVTVVNGESGRKHVFEVEDVFMTRRADLPGDLAEDELEFSEHSVIGIQLCKEKRR